MPTMKHGRLSVRAPLICGWTVSSFQASSPGISPCYAACTVSAAISVLHDVHHRSRTVKSRLDYCNGVLAGLTAQPAAVRGTTNLSRRDHVTVITWPDHVTPLLWRLHWLSFIACKGRQKAIDAWGWPCDVACCSRLLVLQWRHFGGDWKQTIVQCSLIDGSH